MSATLAGRIATAMPSKDEKPTSSRARWMLPHQLQKDHSSTGLKVLAAGLWRCQTSSLQTAFQTLLAPPTFYPSMHGSVIMTDQASMKLALRALMEPDRPRRQALLRQLLQGFNASADFPGMAFVDDLLDLYPDMKVVLNKRQSAAAWARSADVLRFWSTWTYAILGALIPTMFHHRRMYWEYEKLAKRRFGPQTDIWAAEYYDVHNAWVKELCRARGRECLEWEPSMGWEPLCAFLGVQVPKDQFPISNEGEEIRAFKPLAVKLGLGAWAVAFLVMASGAWGLRYWFGR